MPPNKEIPGLHVMAAALMSHEHPEVEPCPTCSQRQIWTADIELETFAKHHRRQLDDPTLPHFAVETIRVHPRCPAWLATASVIAQNEHYITLNGPLACVHQGVINPASTIRGHEGQVTIDDIPLSPARSKTVRNHSPNGFSWGYYGSGPSQLALALLLEAGASEHEATHLYHQFKKQHISGIDFAQPFTMPGATVTDWLLQHRTTDAS